MTRPLVKVPTSAMEVFHMLPEGTMCQVIQKQLVMSPAPETQHQKVCADIYFNIRLSLNNTTSQLFFSSIDVYLGNDHILQPDILLITDKNTRCTVKDKGIFGAPDIIIEVLSPSSKQIDLQKKKRIYEKFGVQEYFAVEPKSKEVLHFFLNNGKYAPEYVTNNFIHSIVLGKDIHF